MAKYRKTVHSGQQVVLTDGMRIWLAISAPSFDVSIPSETSMIQLSADRYPTRTFYPEDGVIPLGRSPEGKSLDKQWLVEDKATTVSRQHATLHCSEKGNWLFSHHGYNDTTIESDQPIIVYDVSQPALKKGGNAADAMLVTPVDDDDGYDVAATVTDPDQLALPGPFAVVPGMTLRLHRELPTYAVSTEGGKLILTSSDPSNGRIPGTIEIDASQPVTAGRRGCDITLSHPRLSARHFEIAWDGFEQAFIYTALGKIPPTILLPGLINEVQAMKIVPAEKVPGKPKAKLEFNDSIAMSPGEAAAQLAELDALMKQAEIYADEMKKVQQFEVATQATPPELQREGWMTEEAQVGYVMWLRIYEMLYRERLMPEESQALLIAADRVEQIGLDRAEYRDIGNYGIPSPLDTFSALLDGRPRDKEMTKYTQGRMQQLATDGDVFLPSGFPGHHAIGRVRMEDGRFRVTLYNAGGGATYAGTDCVYGTEEHLLKRSASPETAIRIMAERKLLGMRGALDDEWDKTVEPGIVRSRTVSSQHKGNCTTRSTREMLRDTLPEAIFADLHRHVSDPTKASAEDMLGALMVKRGKLVQIAGIAGAAQLENSDPASGLRSLRQSPRAPAVDSRIP